MTKIDRRTAIAVRRSVCLKTGCLERNGIMIIKVNLRFVHADVSVRKRPTSSGDNNLGF